MQKPNDQWTTSYNLATEANNTLNILNAAFNKHNIFFVPYSYANSCLIQDFEVHTTNLSIEERRAEQTQNSTLKEDAYHIYIIDPSPILVTGNEFYVPNNFFSLAGSRNGVLSNNTEILVHEAGHNFGLVHTFIGSTPSTTSCNENTSTCSVGSVPSCECCGDYVCDTPFNTDEDIVLSGCSHPTLSESIWRNFMSLISLTSDGSCRNLFTEGQAKRMRVYLKQAPVLQAMQILPVKYPSSTPGAFSNSIIVESGELVIDQDLSMLPGASILVKKGASLVVKATITGACGQMWQGIIVESDKTDLNQSPTLQGSVKIISGGKIEHARVGVDILDPVVVGSGGGIINTSTAFFVNNTIGVRFAPYERAGLVNGAIGQLPNKSSFSTTVFSIDADYRGDPMVSPVHIEMTGIFGLPIKVSLFRDLRASCTSSSIGINSMSGGFNANYSHFENLKFGILTDKLTVGSGSFRTEFCKFQGCVTGISADMLESSFVVRDNTFRLQSISTACDASNPQLLGIAVNGITKDMTCTKNIFQNDNPIPTTPPTIPPPTIIGTHCTGIGTFFNQIKDNQFFEMNIGNKTSGKNGDDIDGLVYFCNTHTNDVLILPEANYLFDGRVRKTQGLRMSANDVLPTRNKFSVALKRIENNAENVDYFYYDSDNSQDPTIDVESSGITAEDVGLENSSCLPIGEPCNPPCNELVLNNVKNAFFQEKVLFNQKQNQLSNTADPTISSLLTKEITMHRQKMDLEAGKILRYYAQDTTQLLVDSILYWNYLVETPESWITIAKHHFFEGSMVAFDGIWNSIPFYFDLSDNETIGYQRLSSLFTLIRPSIIASNNYSNLPIATTNQLKAMLSDCDEAAFVAKAILRRNNINSMVICQPVGIEPRVEQRSTKAKASNLVFVPNPANDFVSIFTGNGSIPQSIYITDALGRTSAVVPVAVSNGIVQINTKDFHSSIYFLYILDGYGAKTGKLIIRH
jgi:hypothetical protein